MRFSKNLKEVKIFLLNVVKVDILVFSLLEVKFLIFEAGESLDDLLPEAFANCREAARRALGLRAYDVQLMGGIFLHQGNISEMKTGEGKTLVATFPAYLNALLGRGVHIVTVNDYLVKRDAEWMSKAGGAVAWTGFVPVAYTIVAQSYGQRFIQPVTANLIYTLQPIATAVVAWLVLGESSLTPLGYAGALILGAAVVLVVLDNDGD